MVFCQIPCSKLYLYIKDKTGRIDQVDNYRPIALASVISKVVEIILLSRMSGGHSASNHPIFRKSHMTRLRCFRKNY